MVMTSNKKVHLQNLYRQKPFVLCLLCSADLLLLRPKYLHLSLPTLQGGDLTGLLEAALPNITGTIDGVVNSFSTDNNDYTTFGSGAFATALKERLNSQISNGNGNDGRMQVTFNAASSNIIYGQSDTVQPPALVLLPQTRY